MIVAQIYVGGEFLLLFGWGVEEGFICSTLLLQYYSLQILLFLLVLPSIRVFSFPLFHSIFPFLDASFVCPIGN